MTLEQIFGAALVLLFLAHIFMTVLALEDPRFDPPEHDGDPV